MSGPKIAAIIPLYNGFAYGRRAVLSFLKHTTANCVAILPDDASPHFKHQDWDLWFQNLPRDRVILHPFPSNKGLTRGWNWGLKKARELGAEFAICTNSDILFTPHWEHGLVYHLNHGFDLVAPVTNAPGPTNNGRQRVGHFFPGYAVNDDAKYLAQVANYLRKHYPVGKIHTGLDINGFFMMAKTATWWSGAFDKDHVFDPSKRMTGNEDELQKRWKKKGRKIGFVPSSFVFHYRAVSRGSRFKHRGWHRLEDIHKPV